MLDDFVSASARPKMGVGRFMILFHGASFPLIGPCIRTIKKGSCGMETFARKGVLLFHSALFGGLGSYFAMDSMRRYQTTNEFDVHTLGTTVEPDSKSGGPLQKLGLILMQICTLPLPTLICLKSDEMPVFLDTCLTCPLMYCM